MPTDYGGIATQLLSLLPGNAIAISSTTNTTPIVLTSAAPHGAETGDTVVVHNHTVNTNTNGSWQVVKTGPTTLILIGSSGNGVGGASGFVRSAAFGTRFNVPSSTDPRKVTSINPALEAHGDRTAMLLYMIQYALDLRGGGQARFRNDSVLKLDAGAKILGDAGAFVQGTLYVGNGLSFPCIVQVKQGSRILTDGGSIEVDGTGLIQIDNGATFTVDTLLDILGAHGSIVIRGGALLDVKGDGDTTGTGDVLVRSGAKLEVQSGGELQVDTGATLDCNGNADFSGAAIQVSSGTTATGTWTDSRETTRDHATLYSGADGYRAGRERYLSNNATGTETINTWEQEYIVTGTTQTADVTWVLKDAPSNRRVDVTLDIYNTRLNGHNLIIKDETGNTIHTVFGTDFWIDLRWSSGLGTWIIVRSGVLAV
jgi:hypothetical protein